MDLIKQVLDLATDPKHTRWIAPLLVFADVAFCAVIIWKVPYTEIDWKAYMQQVEQFLGGERDYTKIKGDTGPLVYPAAHIYIYTALYHLTDHGKNILLGQIVFAFLYLCVLIVVMACYRLAQAPPCVFPLLILSKRLHSIFLLRLFNDCFATGALFLAIYAFQKRMWTVGSIAYSFGLGIKMSLLLVLPAIGVILYQAVFVTRALRQASLMAQLQVILGVPFLSFNAPGYLSRAFELTRQFLFKWTVNWRFIGEDIFLSRPFSLTLLALHVTLLLIFISTRWIKPSGMSLPQFIAMAFNTPPERVQKYISYRITPEFILTTVLTANAIGMLCARSLHYQFYSWIAWATPFLLWRSGMHPILQYAAWAAQEWAWNVYPSTGASSKTVVAMLGVTVAGVWWGTRNDFQGATDEKWAGEHAHNE